MDIVILLRGEELIRWPVPTEALAAQPFLSWDENAKVRESTTAFYMQQVALMLDRLHLNTEQLEMFIEAKSKGLDNGC